MNSVVKYLITDLAVRASINALLHGIEIALIKIDPAKHAEYMDNAIALMDVKTDKFLMRNTKLIEKYAPELLKGNMKKEADIQASFKDIWTGLQDLINDSAYAPDDEEENKDA